MNPNRTALPMCSVANSASTKAVKCACSAAGTEDWILPLTVCSVAATPCRTMAAITSASASPKDVRWHQVLLDGDVLLA